MCRVDKAMSVAEMGALFDSTDVNSIRARSHVKAARRINPHWDPDDLSSILSGP